VLTEAFGRKAGVLETAKSDVAGVLEMSISEPNVENTQIRDTRSPWIGVDLDGTLAADTAGELWDADGNPKIGRPIAEMVTRVKRWVEGGCMVKIFTARACSQVQVQAIRKWLLLRGLPDLEVTNTKDLNMVELWDDRCVQVIPNSGRPVNPTAPRRVKTVVADENATAPKGKIKFLFSLKQIFLML